MEITEFIQKIPKAELHLHIEGTLEPEMIMGLAQKNAVEIPYATIAEIRGAYDFSDLQSFLDLYHLGTQVLKTEQDFYDMTWAYLERAAQDNVRHVEIFTDTQTHTERGIDFATVVNGVDRALRDGEAQLGITFRQILCILRHLSAREAMETLEQALQFRDQIYAIGLASSEVGHPPSKFTEVFDRARDAGFSVVAHAGEEGPPEYIWEALDLLKVDRIDHGVRCLEDADLTARIVRDKVPLTVCPLSNVKLRVFEALEQHNLKAMLDAGICATINSDDPAYFGGYIGTNYQQTQQALNLTIDEIYTLTKNAFEASFLNDSKKRQYIGELDAITNGVRSC